MDDVARSKVGVLGLTFKENCPDIRNSKVVDEFEIGGWNVTVSVSDPWADPDEAMREYGLTLADTLGGALSSHRCGWS